MDPASFVISVLGVVVELYRVSMVTYDLYLSIQDFSPAFRNLRLALEIERKRLELWAQSMGIDQSSAINERLQNDPALLEIIKSILTKMKERFDDSNKLLIEYQGAQSPPGSPENEDQSACTLEQAVSSFIIRAMCTDSRSRTRSFTTHILRSPELSGKSRAYGEMGNTRQKETRATGKGLESL